jgi:methylthioribose-1-phosphate isomerase
MVIRGAPAIGVAAAMGSRSACDAARRRARAVRGGVPEELRHDGRHAADRRQSVLGDRSDEGAFAAAAQAGESPDEIADRLEREARAIHDEDVANCRLMGGIGADVVPDGARV